eukprot:6535143-Alexandrium_andersonii.AAC.1
MANCMTSAPGTLARRGPLGAPRLAVRRPFETLLLTVALLPGLHLSPPLRCRRGARARSPGGLVTPPTFGMRHGAASPS